jgi:hypothetical protein
VPEVAGGSSAARVFSLRAVAVGVAACIGYAALVASGVGGHPVTAILLALGLGGAVVASAAAATEHSRARSAQRLLAISLQDNSRLLATIEEGAGTDPLTGLANGKLLLEAP